MTENNNTKEPIDLRLENPYEAEAGNGFIVNRKLIEVMLHLYFPADIETIKSNIMHNIDNMKNYETLLQYLDEMLYMLKLQDKYDSWETDQAGMPKRTS